MSRTSRTVLRAFSLWTLWVWGTRIWNIVGDGTRSTGFKVVHVVLAVVSVGFAVATWIIATRAARTPAASANMAPAAAPRMQAQGEPGWPNRTV